MMPSTKIVAIAKKIAERDKPLFDALIEFEKTKRIRTKARADFTIDKAIIAQFRKLCREKNYNMSAKVENLMREFLGKEEKK